MASTIVAWWPGDFSAAHSTSPRALGHVGGRGRTLAHRHTVGRRRIGDARGPLLALLVLSRHASAAMATREGEWPT